MRGDTAAGTEVAEATDVEEEEEAAVSEQVSVDVLALAVMADAETMAEVRTEETDLPRPRTRDDVAHLATETMATLEAEETMHQEVGTVEVVTVEAETVVIIVVIMVVMIVMAEELTSTARDQEETVSEVAEEADAAVHEEVTEVAPRADPLAPSERPSPAVR